jgi:putative ABC transport system ATP-binding protein
MLELKNISKTFDKGESTQNILFDGLNLHVDKGEFVSIVGSNGAGKTSLLNIIAGSLNTDTGSILFDGKDITGEKEYKRASKMARVFQDPKLGTCASMTVAENMTLARNKGKKYGLRFGIKKDYLKNFVDRLKSLEMGVEDKLYVMCGQLSGGQRQALALVMSTMTDPDLLLLDEHTAALDPRTSENIMEITDKVVRERNITALMITHNLEYAIRYGDRLVMLHDGKVLLDIKGEEKKSITINQLVELFKNVQGGALTDEMIFN